jgi:hypothetical protein
MTSIPRRYSRGGNRGNPCCRRLRGLPIEISESETRRCQRIIPAQYDLQVHRAQSPPRFRDRRDPAPAFGALVLRTRIGCDAGRRRRADLLCVPNISSSSAHERGAGAAHGGARVAQARVARHEAGTRDAGTSSLPWNRRHRPHAAMTARRREDDCGHESFLGSAEPEVADPAGSFLGDCKYCNER